MIGKILKTIYNCILLTTLTVLVSTFVGYNVYEKMEMETIHCPQLENEIVLPGWEKVSDDNDHETDN